MGNLDMVRSAAFCAFALAALLCAGSPGCSASTASSREVDSPEDSARSVVWVVDPGIRDVSNVHLPAVQVYSLVPTPLGVYFQPCSGVLIDRQVVLTAGHCVCSFRPASRDELLPEKSMGPARAGVRTRAEALRDMSSFQVIDSRSPCAHTAEIVTVVYGKEGPTEQYHGKVLVQPEIELILGSAPGLPVRFRSIADLAVIVLDEPVSLDFQPVTLSDSEVNVGDGFIIVGYGSGGSEKDFGARQYGENKVARRITDDTGNVVFTAVAAAGSKSSAAASVTPGDSGGACLRKTNRNVLIGVPTTRMVMNSGAVVSYFTSIYPHRNWLLDIVRRAHLPSDGGVSVPGSDAGPR